MTSDEALAWADKHNELEAYPEVTEAGERAAFALASEVRRLRDLHNTGRLDVMWQELVAERDAARAEVERLRDLIDAAKNVMLSFYQRAPIEVREWLASVEEPHEP